MTCMLCCGYHLELWTDDAPVKSEHPTCEYSHGTVQILLWSFMVHDSIYSGRLVPVFRGNILTLSEVWTLSLEDRGVM
jgi:hypothetical protein